MLQVRRKTCYQIDHVPDFLYIQKGLKKKKKLDRVHNTLNYCEFSFINWFIATISQVVRSTETRLDMKYSTMN